MARPRLYLFHGNNSQASSADVSRWTEAFLGKYGNATQYVLLADELPWDELLSKLSQALAADSLFAQPKYILVKRAGSTLAAAKVKELIKVVGSYLQNLDDQVTLVFWEDTLLSATHALVVWFKEHEIAKRAQIKSFLTSQGRGIVADVLKHFPVSLTQDARRWLDTHALKLEKQQRLASKLRATEELAKDFRGWSLLTLLESASLLAGEQDVSVEHLERVVGVVGEPVSPFEIINAIERKQWQQARQLAARWETPDEGAYFGLISLLRMSAKKQASTYALQLLGEIELLSKNVTLHQAWLLELYISRLQFADSNGPIIEPKRLWLSHLQRVD